MIRLFVVPVAVFFLAAVASHVVTLSMLPSTIMNKAVDMLADRGLPFHTFMLSPRATPQSQSVVRTSPDVAYSICLFDLADGPVLVEGGAWDSYGSLNVYDGETDNVVAIDLGPDEPSVTGTVLALARDQDVPVPEGLKLHVLNHPQGVALIRRLSPTDEYYARAEEAAAGDVCQKL